ncbi:MAG: DUF4387 domain-containing protein [Defluviitaleaceae bacterium]|nr:DUF4387 domain-containing protein [Defluviitaleaceae bacterium]
MTHKLFDHADVIRSKNSGPYELTFDIIFKEHDMFQRFKDANIMTPKVFAKLYKINESDITGIISFAPAKAVKITIVRPIASGDLGECDVYGAQQHAPLLGFEFEL